MYKVFEFECRINYLQDRRKLLERDIERALADKNLIRKLYTLLVLKKRAHDLRVETDALGAEVHAFRMNLVSHLN